MDQLAFGSTLRPAHCPVDPCGVLTGIEGLCEEVVGAVVTGQADGSTTSRRLGDRALTHPSDRHRSTGGSTHAPRPGDGTAFKIDFELSRP